MWTQISNRLSSLDEDDDYEQDFVEFSDSTNHFHHHHHDGHSQLTLTANHSSRDNDHDDDPSYSEFKPSSSSSSSAKNIHPSTYKLLRDLSNVSKQQNDNMNDMHEIDTLGHGENDFETDGKRNPVSSYHKVDNNQSSRASHNNRSGKHSSGSSTRLNRSGNRNIPKPNSIGVYSSSASQRRDNNNNFYNNSVSIPSQSLSPSSEFQTTIPTPNVPRKNSSSTNNKNNNHLIKQNNRYQQIMSLFPSSMSFSSNTSPSLSTSLSPSTSSSTPTNIFSESTTVSPMNTHRNQNGSSMLSSSSSPIPRLSKGLPPFEHPSLSYSSNSSSSHSSTSSISSHNINNKSTNSSTNNNNTTSTIWMNKPPRSNWNVADNKLKPIPPLYPPIPPNNMIYINDASPSVVACRISECLRKRSIIVDYDDEAAVATCWSKGDNGSGEGELLLFHTGANMKRAMMMKKKRMSKGLNSRDSLSSNNQNGNGGDDNYDEFHKNVMSGTSYDMDDNQSEGDFYDYGISSNGLTCNIHGGGGGCVVFSINLYRGDKDTSRTMDMNNSTSASSGNSIRKDETKQSIPSAAVCTSSTPVSTSSGYKYPYNSTQEDEDHQPFPSDITSIKPSTSDVSDGMSTSQNSPSTSNSSHQSINPDLSHGIIVECMRIRGNTIQFYKDCKAVFAAARGDSDGLDDYRSSKSRLYQSPFCFQRSKNMKNSKYGDFKYFSDDQEEEDDDINNNNAYFKDEGYNHGDGILTEFTEIKLRRSPSELSQTTFSALRNVLDLMEKDQLDSQLLAVKSLALLTDPSSSGVECSYLTSLCILGSKLKLTPSNMHQNSNSRQAEGRKSYQQIQENKKNKDFQNFTSLTAEKLHQKVYAVIMGQVNTLASSTNNCFGDDSEDFIDFSHPFTENKLLMHTRSIRKQTQELPENKLNNIASQYHSTIRGYMMHVLTNALSNLIQNSHHFPLLPQPQCFKFISRDFLEKIAEDIAGATRPPTASFGTAHDATHAVKFLHLIASYSEEGFDAVHGFFVGYGSGSRMKKASFMELLDKACDSGSSSHFVLKVEAMIAKNILMGRASKNQY